MMKKHKWKALVAVITTVLSSIYGINIYTGQNNEKSVHPVHDEISTINNNSQIILQFDETYNMEDGFTIQIKTSPVGHWVVFEPQNKGV